PGHLVAVVEGLGTGQGLSIEARTGSSLPAAPALPEPPADPPEHRGTGLLPPAASAATAAAVAAVPVTAAVRRAGRERVAVGGTADAAYAGAPPEGPDSDEPPPTEIRIDHSE